MTLGEKVKRASKVSTPLVFVTTPDPAAAIASIADGLRNGEDMPLLRWDIAQGLQPGNDAGKASWTALGSPDPMASGNPTEALMLLAKAPERTVVFMLNVHLFLNDPPVKQALWNLRDPYKQNQRMIVGLGTSVQLPAELAQDVVVFDEPLPDATAIQGIVGTVLEAVPGQDGAPDPVIISKAADALTGLSAFRAEQTTAMSLRRDDSQKVVLDMDILRERHRQTIEQTPGLKVDRGDETFRSVGGCANIINFLERIATGRRPPKLVVRLDEIDKMMGGARGDTSGTSQDALGVLLSFMEDHEGDGLTGLLAYGVPGAGKSLLSKALGNRLGTLTLSFDMGAMRCSLVGSSEQRIRQSLKVIEAISGGNCLFMGTCNRADVLPPELQSRFGLGQYMFDAPTAEERAVIWQIYLKKFDLSDQDRPVDIGWTGREIKRCASNAWLLNCPLIEAAQYVVPVSRARASDIDALRKWADGKLLSADYAGTYQYERSTATKQVRALEV